MKDVIKKSLSILSCIFILFSIIPREVYAADSINLTNESKTISEKEESDLIKYIGQAINSKEQFIGEEYSTSICEVLQGDVLEDYDNEINPDRTDEGEALLESEDFEEAYKQSFEVEKLDNITESNYEVSLAKYDGSYIHIDTASTYDEAVTTANNIEEIIKDYDELNIEDEYIPAVIDSNGTTVYATEAIARAIKCTNGKVDNSNVTYLYDKASDVGNKNANYYINHNSIEDVALVDKTDSAVKVLVNGYTGWGKSSESRDGTYDFDIVPINQAVNPSYYIVNNNQLRHFISFDIYGKAEQKGWTITVGVAPSYLSQGTKYYSYDAQYFYTSLSALEKDVQAGVHTNAVNSNNPYYNYYQKLPLRSKTSYTAAQLDSYINANTKSNSKLRGLGSKLISVQNAYGVNAAMILSVAINESGWGISKIAQEKNNLFGLNAVDTSPGQSANTYNSPADCVEQFAKYYMSKGYLDPQDWRYYGGIFGNKEIGIGVKYASDPYWGEKNAAQFFAIDRYISGYNDNNYEENLLKDYNKYTIGILNSNTTVTFDNNSIIYNVKPKKTNSSEIIGSSVIINYLDKINKGGVLKYEVTPQVTDKVSAEFSGNFAWDIYGYVPISDVSIINKKRDPEIEYQTHMQSKGWQDKVGDGVVSGIENGGLRIEALKINLNGYKNATIKYRAYVENNGWQGWKNSGEVSGTENQKLRLEAIQVEASGLPSECTLEYRVYVQGSGWQEWKSSGQVAGSVGKNLRLEAIQMRIAKSTPTVQYTAHVQSIGWQNWKINGDTVGTEGKKLRVEALKINIKDYPGVKIKYRTHVQSIGWQDWKSNGELAGTEGKKLRIEALQIKTEGLPSAYELQYRVHVQSKGWQEWKSSGDIAGTVGEALRIEAIQIRIIKVDPTLEYQAYIQDSAWQSWKSSGELAGTEGKALRIEAMKIRIKGYPDADIKYRVHMQKRGWEDWKNNGEIAGEEGSGLRIEAIQISASGLPENYKLQYRVHIQKEGWQEWKNSGDIAGTIGKALRIESMEIRIVKK